MLARNKHGVISGCSRPALLGALWLLFGCPHREQAKNCNHLILLIDVVCRCWAVQKLASIFKTCLQ